MRSPVNGGILSGGNGQYCTDSLGQQADAQGMIETSIVRRPSRTCTFQGDAGRSAAKGYNVHSRQSAPTGILGRCPACGGETSIRLVEPMNTRGIERRTFECRACPERQAFIVARVSEMTTVMRH
jgi:hypothetical protein